MSPATNARVSTAALAETASSTLSLLRGFSALLTIPITTTITAPNSKAVSASSSTSTTPSTTLPADAPHPLNVLHTSATLLKAHTTKLSLLLINKPFTPSEIRKIISDGIANTCIPAMMGGVEICSAERWGRLLNEEVKLRVKKVFAELEVMMAEVLMQVKEVSPGKDGKNGEKEGGEGVGRDTLLSTGVVWAACDSLMELKDLGVAGVAVKRAQEYREMLEDALKELKEWAESEEKDEDEDEEDEFAATEDDIFDLHGSMPKDKPELKEMLDLSTKRLKLTSTLYQAVGKRRLKTVDAGVEGVPEPAAMEKLDRVLDVLREIPDQVDELAGAFYELDEDEARQRTEEICQTGKRVIELTKLDWKGGEDEFTIWADKWLAAIDRN